VGNVYPLIALVEPGVMRQMLGRKLASGDTVINLDGDIYYAVRGSPADGDVVRWNAAGYAEWASVDHGGYAMADNATAVALTAATPAKVAGTTTAMTLHGFTHSNNRLTYVGTKTKSFMVNAMMCASQAASAARLSMYVAQGGTPIVLSENDSRIANSGDHAVFGLLYNVTLAHDDYIEVWAESDKNGDCTVDELQVHIIED
jgi:hypothetical protein